MPSLQFILDNEPLFSNEVEYDVRVANTITQVLFHRPKSNPLREIRLDILYFSNHRHRHRSFVTAWIRYGRGNEPLFRKIGIWSKLCWRLDSVKLLKLAIWNRPEYFQKCWSNAMNLFCNVETLKIWDMLPRCVISKFESDLCF